MKHRLATAVIMGFGAALGHLENEGLPPTTVAHLLVLAERFTRSLLAGEVVGERMGNTGYPPMKLSGGNEVFDTYNKEISEIALTYDVFAAREQGVD